MVGTRSSGQSIVDQAQVFLGDTIGEMGLYLGLTDIAFMGKSLKSEGGQNPIEPVMTNTAILSGRFVQNFRETYQALLDNGGARLVKDENMLAGHVLHLLRNRKDLETMQQGAMQAVQQMTGALERSIEVLDPYVMPLRVKVELNKRQRIAGGAPVNTRSGGARPTDKSR